MTLDLARKILIYAVTIPQGIKGNKQLVNMKTLNQRKYLSL